MSDGASPRSGPLKVIVADDDDDARWLVCEILRADGHSVVEAHDGAELLHLVEAALDGNGFPSSCDLVVSDVMMPQLSGFGVLGALHRAHLQVPVILMTAMAHGSMNTVGLRLGAAGVLHKPFDVDELRGAVRDAVGSR